MVIKSLFMYTLPNFFQRWVDSLIKEHEYIQFLSYIPKILLAIIIPIFDDLYHKVAVWLNDLGELNNSLKNNFILHIQKLGQLISNFSENYRSDESFEEHFVLKLILVSTVALLPCIFISLFYIQKK